MIQVEGCSHAQLDHIQVDALIVGFHAPVRYPYQVECLVLRHLTFTTLTCSTVGGVISMVYSLTLDMATM